MAKKMKWFDWLAVWLLIIGGLNWGLVGVSKFNLVSWIFGSVPWLENLIYILVGLSALYSIWVFARK